jgi:hypothetical protein
MSSLTRSEEDKGPSGIPAPCVQMVIEREGGRRCWQDGRVPWSGVADQGENGQVTAEIGALETRIGLTICQSESAPGTALAFLVAA